MTKMKSTGRKRTILSIKAPEAEKVYLAGDFNGWNPKKHPMKKNSNGIWEKTVMLPPGTYQYKFWMDDQWRHDETNTYKCVNGYGTLNNVVIVKD